MTRPNEQYPDLLGDRPDPDLEHLVADLDRIALGIKTVNMPAHHEAMVKRVVFEHAAARTKQPQPLSVTRWHTARPARRRNGLLVAAAVLCILFLTTGTVLAINRTLVDDVLSYFDKISQKNQHHQLGQTVNIVQHACGFTMTVQRVSADANSVIIGYDIKGPSDRSFMGAFDLWTAALTDTHGVPLLSQGGGSSGISKENEAGDVMVFDASEITGNPHVVGLHLKVPSIHVSEQFHTPKATPFPCETIDPTTPVKPGVWLTTIFNVGFTFDLTAPFDPGYVVNVHQKVTSDGITVTLDRIVFTHAETRFYLQAPEQFSVFPKLFINKKAYWGNASSGQSARGTIFYSFDGSLYNQHGQWQLVFDPEHGPPPPFVWPKDGLWTFSINIP